MNTTLKSKKVLFHHIQRKPAKALAMLRGDYSGYKQLFRQYEKGAVMAAVNWASALSDAEAKSFIEKHTKQPAAPEQAPDPRPVKEPQIVALQNELRAKNAIIETLMGALHNLEGNLRKDGTLSKRGVEKLRLAITA